MLCLYMPHDSFVRVPSLIHMCDMTCLRLGHGPGTGRVVNSYEIQHHYFPASAESAVLPMDTQVTFLAVCFFRS